MHAKYFYTWLKQSRHAQELRLLQRMVRILLTSHHFQYVFVLLKTADKILFLYYLYNENAFISIINRLKHLLYIFMFWVISGHVYE